MKRKTNEVSKINLRLISLISKVKNIILRTFKCLGSKKPQALSIVILGFVFVSLFLINNSPNDVAAISLDSQWQIG